MPKLKLKIEPHIDEDILNIVIAKACEHHTLKITEETHDQFLAVINFQTNHKITDPSEIELEPQNVVETIKNLLPDHKITQIEGREAKRSKIMAG